MPYAFSPTEGISDLLYVATNVDVCCLPPPESFEPDMSEYTKPVDPGSLDSHFGLNSDYEWKGEYARFYDKENNSWTDGGSGTVNADVKADVATQLEAIRIYNSDLKEYNSSVYIERSVQWRKKVAQALISACS